MSLPEIKPAHLCLSNDKFEVVNDMSAAEALVRGYRGDPQAMNRLRALVCQTDQDIFLYDDYWLLDAAARKILKGELRVRRDPCERKNEENRRYLDWIMTYRKDAIEVAMGIRQLPANILGLAAVESEFGDGQFATYGNNFFGLRATKGDNLPHQIGYMVSGVDPKVVVAKFEDFLHSAKCFVEVYGVLIKGETDPRVLANILQLKAKFGRGPRGPIDGYVEKVTAIVHELQLRWNC